MLADRGEGDGGDTFRLVEDLAWDRYQFLEFLAAGGSARVYKAFDPRLQRWVALKFLKQGVRVRRDHILKEARAQAQVEHPHICRVYEVAEVEGIPYISMQLVGGETFHHALERLEVREKVEIVRDVAEGIHAAHRLGLLHLDLKPGNILLERREGRRHHAFVADFGVGRSEGSRDEEDLTLGTPPYASPEQVAGRAPTWTAAATSTPGRDPLHRPCRASGPTGARARASCWSRSRGRSRGPCGWWPRTCPGTWRPSSPRPWHGAPRTAMPAPSPSPRTCSATSTASPWRRRRGRPPTGRGSGWRGTAGSPFPRASPWRGSPSRRCSSACRPRRLQARARHVRTSAGRGGAHRGPRALHAHAARPRRAARAGGHRGTPRPPPGAHWRRGPAGGGSGPPCSGPGLLRPGAVGGGPD